MINSTRFKIFAAARQGKSGEKPARSRRRKRNQLEPEDLRASGIDSNHGRWPRTMSVFAVCPFRLAVEGEKVRPQEIENESMRIIREELREHGILQSIPDDRLHVVMRVIHATADFDFAETLVFSPTAIQAADEALRKNPAIVSDTNMIASGINKRILAKANGSVRCYMSDPDVEREAVARGETRATVSMERAVAAHPYAIYVIGNAPTALIRLCELMRQGAAKPALVIGVPVGFVNVVESKEELVETAKATATKTPYIVANGRKGGSTVAVAIVNALLLGMK